MKGLAPTPPSSGHRLDPFESSLGLWEYCANLAETWWFRHGGVQPRHLARQRLRALLRHARGASPFHRRRLAHLPPDADTLDDVPVLTRAELMANFEAACTDPAIRRGEVERFLADRSQVGALYRGRYAVWKSSGTSGAPGIFVHDSQALAVYAALVGVQMGAARMRSERMLAAGARSALVAATGDHFASITTWEHLRHAWPAAAARAFSVLAPLSTLVAELEAWQPAMLASYPSVLALLAAEARAGRLAIAPALAWSGGETLTPAMRRAIEAAFGCPVVDEYGASECLSIASGCPEGWLHVNEEWVVLEPVDGEGRATRPGETSHTVLVTDLANAVQPIIRYDLGDRITLRRGPCACGNPAMAIRVDGRRDDVLRLRAAAGPTVALAPLAVTTVIEDAIGERRFQLVQSAPDALSLRLDAEGAERRRLFDGAANALHAWLATQGLAQVRVALAPERPRIDVHSGKLHAVVAEARCRTTPRH